MKKAFILTAGTCWPHGTDSDLIKRYLQANGWTLAKKIKTADVIIINTCAVMKENENKSIKFIEKAHEEKNSSAQLIVTGCLPAINNTRLKKIFKGPIVNAKSLHKLDRLLNAKIKIDKVKYIGSFRSLKKINM